MNKKTLIPVILSVLLFTSCGESYESGNSIAPSDTKNSIGTNYNDSYSDTEESAEAENSNASSENNTSDSVIRKEMLVYSCNMTVDVLDFDTAVNSFKDSLNTYGAFIENENYSDGGANSKYIYPDSEKWQSYVATVRVPSKDYEVFCDNAAALGDLRSKNASVQNLSREYYDLSATLEIYEAKEQRYMDLLSDITDENYAITVEKELTEIQIEISKIRTRMNDISTDVAYSYVYITINEVREYAEEPVKTDTFMQRLGKTISDSTSSFLGFMEDVLFLFIFLFPHLIIIGIIVFIIVKISKASKKRKMNKIIPPASPMAEKTEEIKTENENRQNGD